MTERVWVFLAVIVVLLAVAARGSQRGGGKESMLVAGGNVSTSANGLAITGEFASVATFLGLVGGVSLSGFAGFTLILGVPLGFLVLLVVVAEPLRRTGRYTVGDTLAHRFPSRHLRGVVGTTGLMISALYMVGQFVGAGSLISTFFGFSYPLAILVIGLLTLVLVLMGGMSSATSVQVTKTVLLLTASAATVLLMLHRTGWDPVNILQSVEDRYGTTASAPPESAIAHSFDSASAVMATVFGIAGMPHLMVRLLTVDTAAAARRSTLVSIWVMSCYLVVMGFVGYGAALLVGRDAIAAASPGGTTATIQLADVLGGPVFAAVVAGLVFAIIAAVLAGLVVSMMGTIAHDLYGEMVTTARLHPRRQLVVARAGAIAVTVLVSLAALGAKDMNLIFVGTFALGAAASTILPVMVLSLYWRRFSLPGALSAIGAGLLFSLVLLVLGPNVLGTAALVPFGQPALITIPIAFLAGWAGTVVPSHSTRRAAPIGAATGGHT